MNPTSNETFGRHVVAENTETPARDELSRSDKARLTRLANDVLTWWDQWGRDFPWRSEQAGPFEKIVVEVLLQRTTATAVSGFYSRFMDRFPCWERLADAAPEELEEFLRPLGLWRRRAASLLGLAKYASATGGNFPKDPAKHVPIPAVGQYVSNAVLLFQHDKRMPLLDGNMARVIERVVRPRRLADIRHDPWLQAAARWLIRRGPATSINWAVLDFAAVVCRARSPRCDSCPIAGYCTFFQEVRSSASKNK